MVYEFEGFASSVGWDRQVTRQVSGPKTFKPLTGPRPLTDPLVKI